MSETQQWAATARPLRASRGRVLFAFFGALALLATVLTVPSSAHESENDGHIAANVNYGFEVLGRDTLAGIQDGKYTDVWSENGYAYIGTFQTPDCTDTGVYVVDIQAAIDNYGAAGGTDADGVAPAVGGAQVAFIKAPPDTRVNDVKTITIGDTTVLITTEEPCGAGINGGAVSDFNTNKPCPITGRDADGDGVDDIADCNRANTNGNKDEIGKKGPGAASQHGRGGISLWDVTDPTKPKPLEKSFLDFGGVHNTYPWHGVNGGTYLIGTADTFDFFDTFIVDISDPANPEALSLTGALDWVPVGLELDQLETGQSAGIFNHDVWVEQIDGRDIAVVSYWDAGFVTLDVTDPANPEFLGDSTYPETDPLGRPYEGNAHAAVFGGNGSFIIGGDEDFDATAFGVTFEGVTYDAGPADFGPSTSAVALEGEVVWTGGEGCSAGEIPDSTNDNQIALIQRGTCEFSTKAARAGEAGYVGYIVANDATRGDALITMAPGVEADAVDIPGVFVGYSTGELMKAGGSVSGAGNLSYNGWGYLRVLNNTGGLLSVPDKSPGPEPKTSVDQLGEIGYYAPAETLEEPEGDPYASGDLTMHNIEVDPSTEDVEATFDGGPRMFVSWYSLGMRALEYRPGHWHTNANGEGSYSWNVHEVGRYIAPVEGSNFWGVHVDAVGGQQVVLASDRNTGLWIFTFGCEGQGEVEGPFYCDGGSDTP